MHHDGIAVILIPTRAEFFKSYSPYWYQVLDQGYITPRQHDEYGGYGYCVVGEVRGIGDRYTARDNDNHCLECTRFASRFLVDIISPYVDSKGNNPLIDNNHWHRQVLDFIKHVATHDITDVKGFNESVQKLSNDAPIPEAD